MAVFYTGNTGRSTGPHLDFRVWDVEKGGYVDPTRFTSALTSGGKGINQFTMTSPYGADRGSYIHEGVDYATEIGTPIEVKGEYLGTFNDGRGGITSQYAHKGDDGRFYDLLLMHGSDDNAVTMGGAKHDFDYGLLDDAEPIATALETPDTETMHRSEAKQRAQEYINRDRTAAEVVDSLGNNFGDMKSERLGAALAGAQEDIIEERMRKGMHPGTIRVLK